MTTEASILGSFADFHAGNPGLDRQSAVEAYSKELTSAKAANGMTGLTVMVVPDQSFETLQNRGE